jgi:dolichol-phosphate mannosyltransferase
VPELAIVVPTLNERKNIDPLIALLQKALGGIDYEIVFVDDDSPDGTASYSRQVAQTNPRVRSIHRLGRRGLASAAVEGMLASSAPYVAVIDGDMQHDERVLPRMLEILRNTDAELVVGTRNAEGGDMGNFAAHRVAISRLGQKLSALVSRTKLSDPMSGFFMLRRTVLDEVVYDLSMTGFKILLDIISSAHRPLRVAEVGYTFRNRKHGESKLDAIVAIEFIELLIGKLTRGWIPVSYFIFGLVGLAGVGLNAILLHFLRAGGLTFEAGQAYAGAIVSCINYFLNNRFTFRLNRLRGSGLWIGFVLFVAVCAIGLAINVRFAVFLANAGLAHLFASSIGIIIGSVWNYWVTSVFVWRINRAKHRRRRMQKAQHIPAAAVSARSEA